MKKLLAWVMALMLGLPAMAAAEAPEPDARPETVTVEDAGLTLSDSSVRYPRVTGMGDEALEAAVNEQIQTGLGIAAYLNRVPLLMSDPGTLTVTYEARLLGDVFTAAAEASGAVVNSRPTHVWSAVNVDLRDGHAIGLDELFAEPEAAREALEAYLEDMAAELSAHLSASGVTPLPETFALSPYGLTLLYPIEQLSTLADRAGAVTILWSEIQQWLNLEEDGVLSRIGAAENLDFPEDAKARLTEALAEGSIPGIPAAIGQSVRELTDAYGLQTDPDLYEGGRMFLPDHQAFRQVWLLTDALTSGWENSVVQGFRADRLNLMGLRTGATTREDYLAALGEPENSLQVDEERALDWRIVPGTSDYYTLGHYRLRLHVDEEGVLRSVLITQ